MDMDDGYIFIVDTNKYAGNFTRELCAFTTGIVGASGTGKKEAERFFQEIGLISEEDRLLKNPFIDIVVEIPRDSQCCCTPCSIWGNEINSVAIFLCERPPDELIITMKARARTFCNEQKIRIKNFRLIRKQSVYTEEKI